MIDRLRKLKKEELQEEMHNEEEFKRPFALFAKSPVKERRSSTEGEARTSSKLRKITAKGFGHKGFWVGTTCRNFYFINDTCC